MTDTYRKLSKEELRAVYNALAGHFVKPSELQTRIVAHVKKYYPAVACYAVLTVKSEYNDQTYDNTLGYLAVYDQDGIEILPIPATAKVSRREWSSIRLNDGNDEGSSEPMEDLTVHINTQPLPELYIKKL